MIFSKKILSKVMLLLFGVMGSGSIFASVGRASRSLIITGKQASRLLSSSSQKKPIATYFPFDERKMLPHDACTTKVCALKLPVFDFQRQYDEEMHEAFMNRDQQTRLQLYPIIDEKYRRFYEQHREVFDKDISVYRQDRFPQIVSELAVQESRKTDLLRNIYEKAFDAYTAMDTRTIGDCYDMAKCMNAVELQRESVQPKIDLKNYILAFAHQRNAQSDTRDHYAIKSVNFSKDSTLDVLTPHGRLSALGQYDRGSEKVNLSSGLFSDKCLTEQALTVMHEIGHAKQPYGMMLSAAEQDADRHAVQECNCPICLKIMEVTSPSDRAVGYFKPEDYRQAAQKATHRCPAHQHDTAALEDALARRDCQEVEKLDNCRGSIFDRLPKI